MVMLGAPNGSAAPASDALDSQMTLLDRRLTELESNLARLVDKLDASGVPANSH
jgi:hypothetical protein